MAGHPFRGMGGAPRCAAVLLGSQLGENRDGDDHAEKLVDSNLDRGAGNLGRVELDTPGGGLSDLYV